MKKFDLTFIIDDDKIFVFVFKKILQKIGVFNEVKNIQNGYEALTILKNMDENNESFPDLIFLDLNMPIIDGWQFLDEIELLPFKDKLNIYIISSTIDSSEIEKSKNYESVLSFISKPVINLELCQLLETGD